MDESDEQSSVAENAMAIIDAVAPDNWREKMKRVAAQLLVGTEWGKDYYLKARDTIDEAEGRSKVNTMLAEAVGQQAISDPAQIERAKARFLGNLYRKQENLEAVIAKTAEHIKDAPAAADATKPDNISEMPLDSDFAAAFSREAEIATSEQLRDRLARLLAGEMKAPGTYSRSTLRMIAELDQDDIRNFRSVLEWRARENIIIPEKGLKGQKLLDFLIAEGAGLLTGANSTLTMNCTIDHRGLFGIFGTKFGIVLCGNLGVSKTYSFVPLTRGGLAISNHIEYIDEKPMLCKLAGFIDKSGITKIDLVSILSEENNLANYATIETLYQSSQ